MTRSSPRWRVGGRWLHGTFDRVRAVVLERTRTAVPFDGDRDAWHAPTQCVWDAYWTALVAGVLACGWRSLTIWWRSGTDMRAATGRRGLLTSREMGWDGNWSTRDGC
jgi:hypothetical protein